MFPRSPCFVAVSTRDENMLMCVEMPSDAEQIWPLLRQCALEEIEFREEENLQEVNYLSKCLIFSEKTYGQCMNLVFLPECLLRRMLRENRELMEQQEREYRESEERDRAMIAERRRQKKLQEEETFKRNREEQERTEKLTKRTKILKQLRDEIVANHPDDNYDGKDSIRVLVRYPSGETKSVRSYFCEVMLSELFRSALWVSSQEACFLP
ncbi:hypothetical protein KIN20_011627 [Parelaphostrongylus tenuis]|uniref:UBX domain-containing protein n=1 Tax=Parelaphostrongylus tenuis TaxID=148309 RepID=A0AAD5MVN7_PARTN|nr:hypothetical protein KIN20_011627 [Parelaphostrongylus tenuis]